MNSVEKEKIEFYKFMNKIIDEQFDLIMNELFIFLNKRGNENGNNSNATSEKLSDKASHAS